MIGLFVLTISAAALITLGLIIGVILNLLTPLLGLSGVLLGILKFAYDEKRTARTPILLRRPVRIDIRH